MNKEKTKVDKGKSSWYLPVEILEAMRVVKEFRKIPVSGQLEMGALMYLAQHKELLKEHGIELWK